MTGQYTPFGGPGTSARGTTPAGSKMPQGLPIDPLVKRTAEKMAALGNGLQFYRRAQLGFVGGTWHPPNTSQLASAGRVGARPMMPSSGRNYLPNEIYYADVYRDEHGDYERAARQEAERRQQEQGQQEAANWANWEGILLEAAKRGVNEWIASSFFVTGMVEGRILEIPAGAFWSNPFFRPSIAGWAADRGVPSDVADRFGAVIWEAWNEWVLGWSVRVIGYPLFDPYFFVVAPPTPNTPFALSLGSSTAWDSLTESKLIARLYSALSSVLQQVGGASPREHRGAFPRLVPKLARRNHGLERTGLGHREAKGSPWWL